MSKEFTPLVILQGKIENPYNDLGIFLFPPQQ